jgi:transposase
MDLAGYVVNAVLVEKRSVAEVASAHDVSRSWLYELLARYREQGDEGLRPASRRPRSSPARVSDAIEDEIVELRKSLADEGLDAGAHTIHYHLLDRHRRGKARAPVPSVASIWRVLKRRGFIVAQPQKRPVSSRRRFCAELPNECWQTDTTHWSLLDGSGVEILNFIDDHSRLCVGSSVFETTRRPTSWRPSMRLPRPTATRRVC